MAALLGVILLLSVEIQVYAQNRTATTSLAMLVRPEVLLQRQNSSVIVKIRLARGATAHLWTDKSCTLPSPESQVIIASGTYTIPLNTLTPVNSELTSSSNQVCLVSSDGVLHGSLPVEVLEAGSGTNAQAAKPLIMPSSVAVDVPAGWAVTTRAGTITWSNP